MASIHFHKVGKRFGATPALQDVTLAVAPSKISAVIGRSGCGKSTLLKMINGLVRPDTGQVDVFGGPINYRRLPEFRKRIGYAVQGTGLFPHLTVARNITLLAQLEGWSRENSDRRLAQLLTLVQLDSDLLGRYPHELSGGQQQRVGLCRAMMLQPAILLLDEPFAALDPLTRNDIHQQLLELQKAEPTTVVLVTHDMREALKLADHIVVMAQGRIIRQAPTEQLIQSCSGEDPDQLLLSLMEGVAPV